MKGNRRQDMLGKRIGYIKVVKQLNVKCGQAYFLMKCDLCGAEKKVGHYSINNGRYNVCEHDAL